MVMLSAAGLGNVFNSLSGIIAQPAAVSGFISGKIFNQGTVQFWHTDTPSKIYVTLMLSPGSRIKQQQHRKQLQSSCQHIKHHHKLAQWGKGRKVTRGADFP